MTGKRTPLELMVLFYFLSYIPNIIVTRLATTIPNETLGRPLTGLETLPSTLLMNLVMTYLFIWFSGWHKDANAIRMGGLRTPVPTRYTFLSGIGTALILFTVPLSLTFEGVSIPFIQLLMRGDILIIAPLVDFVFRRKVRWWSWTALAMVFVSLIFVIQQRGGLGLPPLAIATIVLYTIGYFTRLAVMTHVSKNGDDASVRAYFVEEKVIALPISVAFLALLSLSGLGSQGDALRIGFVEIWTDPVMVKLFISAFTLTIISVFAAVILLNPRENTYCVPLERSASLLAGIVAAFILAMFWGREYPTGPELIGAAILVAAIVLLSVAPHMDKRRKKAQALVGDP